jgi:hypothetical protein
MGNKKGRSRRSRPATKVSTATANITQALREIAGRYSFLYHEVERRYQPERGRKSERVDVVYLLHPDEQPIFWFEIDNNPTRAADNLFKLFGYPHRLIPVTALAVHHGRVAKEPHAYSKEILSDSVFPPRFLDSLSISTESYELILSQLSDWIEKVFSQLASAPEWGTVLGIAAQYQTLIASGGLYLAAAHLESQAELAWSLSEKGIVEVERAACLTISLARMLQRAGYHRAARAQMAKVRTRVPRPASLSRSTASAANALMFMLGGPDGRDDVFSPKNLQDAFNSVNEDYNKSQFLWRSAIPYIISGDRFRTERIIKEYRDLLSNSTAAQSNISLLEGLDALKWRRGNWREMAAEHSRYEHYLLEREDGPPEGTIHGFIAAIYLKVTAEASYGNRQAVDLLVEIDTFCREAGVPSAADGIREIKAVLPDAIRKLPKEVSRSGSIRLWPQTSRRIQRRLNALHSKVELVCGTRFT